MTNHDVTPDGAAITPYADHAMITRSRALHIDETTDPEDGEARKKQVVAPLTKRRKVDQALAKADDERLAIECGMLMNAPEEVPRSDDEQDLKVGSQPKHQRAIGCRWVFSLKRDETGRIVRHEACLVAKGYSQRHGIDYEETYSPVASLNSICVTLAKFCEDGAIIEQCDVDTALLYGDLDEEIYMEVPEGLMEILGETCDDDEDLVCLLEKCLYGLKQTSRVWNETIDRHLKSKADPCVYTRDDNDQRCVVCLYVDDMLIA
ncbi:unnamed protein product [Phytophthora fragariaefolia]|uniref:Unnamed protein product n=1 Tax=Phytophthora fragariaefolia TaxID=1490495 RepID=A0A9W6Y8I3_9STRA|nr:unnamed protein product [Phytophthora fragariaefolia]